METNSVKKKGLKRLIVGAIIALLGTPLVAILTLLPVIKSSKSVETFQFLAPGEFEFSLQEIKKPTKYYLWNEYVTNFEGKVYRLKKELPDGFSIEVFDADGEKLKFQYGGGGSSTTTTSSGTTSKSTIGYVRVDKPLKGKIVVKAEDEMKSRVIGFAPSPFRHTPAVLLSIGLAVVTLIVGAALLIWGTILKINQPKGHL